MLCRACALVGRGCCRTRNGQEAESRACTRNTKLHAFDLALGGGGMFEPYMKIVLMFGSIDESEACFETFHTLVNYSNSVGIF